MTNIKIYVEGKADFYFVKDYVSFLNGLELDKNNILDLGGKDKLKFKVNDLQRINDMNGINIVIFDANSDPSKRRKELHALKEEIQVEFEVFLFPNDKDSGELENLLCQIINKKHSVIFDCFEGYEKCLKEKENYFLPNVKSKLYAYVDAVKEGEDLFPVDFQNKEHWDLDNPALEPLKEFLNRHIQN